MRLPWLPLALCLLSSSVLLADQPSAPAGAVRVAAGTEVYVQGTAPFPPTVKVAVLEGDPSKPGHFTARIKLPAKFTLPPHTHSAVERTTVISGAVSVAFGRTVDRSKALKLGPGSFYLNPKDEPHWVATDDETVIQISTDGPWDVKKLAD
jgi:quercetin dioxygenase-like cupin family protein